MACNVYREWEGRLQHIGALDDEGGFTYAAAYLASPNAAPISHSLPLRQESYDAAQAKPYFAGLLPEGNALAGLAASLGFATSDYLGLLANCGLDCVGDVVVNPGRFAKEKAYEPFDVKSLVALQNTATPVQEVLNASKLSLAGTQDKVGLYHDTAQPEGVGWFRPLGGAASNYIVKLPNEKLPALLVIEQLTMMCASACGLNVAKTFLVNPNKPLIAVERFDRAEQSGAVVDGYPAPLRRHQEDLAQAFGVLPEDKYAELPGGTVLTVSTFLDEYSAAPALDKRAFLQLLLFNYAMGNCDNHLKNHSILYSKNWKMLRLAPAYDLVSTTYYARFSRNMGISIGAKHLLEDVRKEDLLGLAQQLVLSPKLVKGFAGKLVETLVPALQASGRELGTQGFEEAPYIADEMEEDIASRIEVLKQLL